MGDEGRKRRLGFGKKGKSSFTVHRSEEVLPEDTASGRSGRQPSSASSDGEGSGDGDRSEHTLQNISSPLPLLIISLLYFDFNLPFATSLPFFFFFSFSLRGNEGATWRVNVVECPFFAFPRPHSRLSKFKSRYLSIDFFSLNLIISESITRSEERRSRRDARRSVALSLREKCEYREIAERHEEARRTRAT